VHVKAAPYDLHKVRKATSVTPAIGLRSIVFFKCGKLFVVRIKRRKEEPIK